MNGETVVKAFIPLPGGATAVYTSGPTLSYFRHPDWLGSSRFASTAARTMYYSGAYAPFGEAYAEAGTADRSFTGQSQDTSAGSTVGLYDFVFREYAQYGRWISPDPAGLAAVDITNPQSWNRYAYVLNGPTNLIDPLGLKKRCTKDDPNFENDCEPPKEPRVDDVNGNGAGAGGGCVIRMGLLSLNLAACPFGRNRAPSAGVTSIIIAHANPANNITPSTGSDHLLSGTRPAQLQHTFY
jgi:RHS repeat-associated protein